MNMQAAIDKLLHSDTPDFDALLYCLNCDEAQANTLFEQAHNLTQRLYGDTIYIRSIIEFSSHCRCLCKYCGLNAKNNTLTRYRMTPSEIIANAIDSHKAGYQTVVLQSGEDLYYTKDMISDIVSQIKKQAKDLAITLSIGERPLLEYDAFKKSGADRFLIKHETSDTQLYNDLHPHSDFQTRVACQQHIKQLGFELGSGFMVGLPNQTTQTLANDIIHLHTIKADMAGIGPFIPHEQTTLADDEKGSIFMTLKCLALARLTMKTINLPATTALAVRDATSFKQSFFCGANVVMKKTQPHKYRAMYDIYPKPIQEEQSIKDERLALEALLTSLGKSYL